MNTPSRFLLLAALALPAHAATVTWDGGGSDALWTTPGNWSDDAAPASGNDYVVDASLVRSPDASSNTFAGDSLTVQNGGVLNLYRTNGGGYFTVTHDIPSLTVSNSEIRPQSSLGSIGHILSQSVELSGAVTLNMNENSAFTMRIFFSGGVTGSGSLNVTRDTTGTTRSFEFGGDSSSYAGNISFAGVGGSDAMEFNVSNSGGWGSGALSVGSFGILNLNQDFSTTAAIAFGVNGTTLNLNSASTVGGLSIDGTPVAAGTYDAADLAALGLGGSYGGTGTLTVVPEPHGALLGALGILGLLRRRKP